MTNCRTCINHRNIPGDCHVLCTKPDWDYAQSAPDHAMDNGWWFYPFNYDPAWATVDCKNFKATEK